MTITLAFSSRPNFAQFILRSAWLLCNACGGQTELDTQSTNAGGTSAGTGGTWVVATGGSRVIATGGTRVVAATGGTAGLGARGGTSGVAATAGAGAWIVGYTGTAGYLSFGGGSPVGYTGAGGLAAAGGAGGLAATGGVGGAVLAGGTTAVAATGGTGGVIATGGVGGALSCTTVVCPSIPSSCKKIVQVLGACCATCTDTGCDPCGDLVCASGKHPETAAGDCCPKCVDDPPDACTTGQQGYASMRKLMLEKCSSSGCKNSSDCVLVPENNLCVWNCDIPLPSTMSSSFVDNLTSNAQSYCATCPTPAPVLCERMIPACVNGKCVAANPS